LDLGSVTSPRRNIDTLHLPQSADDLAALCGLARADNNLENLTMTRGKTKRSTRKPTYDPREQVLAVFADYAEQDVDKLFAFLQHCAIDLEPLADNRIQLPDLILTHFYIRPGIYDINRLGHLLATFPPIAARIREVEAELGRAKR
jgi:hypothetical protein